MEGVYGQAIEYSFDIREKGNLILFDNIPVSTK